jgi:hypothetical protein
MTRRLLNFLTITSSLLCVATAGLWARSYCRRDELSVGSYLVTSSRGGVYVESLADQIMRALANPWPKAHFTGHAYPIRPGDPPPPPAPFLVMPVYYAIPTSAALILPGACVARARRQRIRRARGLCPVCAYDLRATPDRCPECGTVALAGEAVRVI